LRKDTGADGSRGAGQLRLFRRILIANRGEIAVRVIRACRELGIESVAVYSDADAAALHRRLADHAVHIGPAAAAESYLRVDKVVAAAIEAGADAIHPGYGFLSEQAALADACTDAGITFIGPARDTLAQLGDKLAARRHASNAGVPVVPGTFEPMPANTDDDRRMVAAEAERIGYPILVKAAAGGGGRGMRRVSRPDELVEAVQAAAREASAAFGDAAVYLERYVEGARHVEVQLLGDGFGNVVALGERDCSIQRRHQKLVEEAPAPGLTRDQRLNLHGLGVRVAQTVGLRNAATAEFLLTPEGDFWFLEVNARLQVEHGVTELVADLDLVHEQIAIAAGGPLSDRVLAAAASAIEPVRHAIEVRLTAEDPASDFVPAPATLTRWRPAAGPGVRIDAGVEEGSAIPGDYDSMFAKLMVAARTRDEAIARMARALNETEIAGVQTTVPFYRWLLTRAEFTDASGAGLSTDLVARIWDPAPLVAEAALRAAELAAAAGTAEQAYAAPRAATGHEPARTAPQDSAWWSAGVREAMEQRT
jgi:acetyl/propionyl-CoA carboxylase alpha subunit